MRIHIFGLIGLTAAGLALAAGCSRQRAELPKASPAGETTLVSLSAETLQGSGVKIEEARMVPLAATVTSTGVVGLNKRRYACVSARVAGIIERVEAYEGERIKAGQALAALYSPDYLAAQQDLLQLLRQQDREAPGAAAEATAMTERLVRSAAGKLGLMGATEEDIRKVIETRSLESRLILRAPFSGTILSGSATPGRQVQSGADLFEVADLDSLWVEANIHEKDLALMTPGCSASVSVPAWPGEEFPGRLALIGDVEDEATRTVKARVEIANSSRKLKPGMYAEVSLSPPVRERILAVPESAVREIEGRAFVFEPRPSGAFEPRPVKTGRRTASWVEIIDGLKPGDRIVTQGSFSLKAELLKRSLEGEE